jgi:hypothetical protein
MGFTVENKALIIINNRLINNNSFFERYSKADVSIKQKTKDEVAFLICFLVDHSVHRYTISIL